MSGEPLQHVLTWSAEGVEMGFRLLRGGMFRMGSREYYSDEEPTHRVSVGDFWLAETPVTQAQFALWTTAEKIEHENHFKNRPDHPAENMDWRQAVAFCAWLTRTKAGELPVGFGLACLPTEAEWEYACRAGTDTEFYTGDGEAALTEAGWFGEEWGKGSTHPVRQKAPNAWRLFDLHGNVWEWCHDVWDESANRRRIDGDPDPGRRARTEDYRQNATPPTKDDLARVLRGGSWFSSAVGCRSACRSRFRPVARYGNFGFRVCLVPDPAASPAGQPARGAEAKPGRGDGAARDEPAESDRAGFAAAGARHFTSSSTPA